MLLRTVDPSGRRPSCAPAWAVVAPGARRRAAMPRQDEPLHLASRAAALAPSVEPAETMAAVRQMYKQVGLDPTKTRPSSEALWRRVRRGDELPRINSLVDIINWCSVRISSCRSGSMTSIRCRA